MVNPLLTLETFIFDLIYNTIIIVSTIIIFKKTREIYNLSLQRGILYFSNAMIFYVITYVLKYIFIISMYVSKGAFFSTLAGLILNLLIMFGFALGGFYLAYSLVWRKFEEKRKITHFSVLMSMLIIGLIISLADTYLFIAHKLTQAYVFHGTVIIVLLLATISNCKRCGIAGKEMTPFLSLVGISLGVYVVSFIETLLFPFLYTIHFYAGAVYMVFFLAFLYNVIKITKD